MKRTLGGVGFTALLELLPELSWREGQDGESVGDVEEVPVTRHQHFGEGLLGLGQDRYVVRVAEFEGKVGRPGDHHRLPPEECLGLREGYLGYVHLLTQHPSQFSENRLAENELVFSEHHLENVCADAASGERADQDIGVEEDPQETSRKTSSSVR